MKTKAQLLARMKELGACSEATEYVTEHKSRSANEIGQDCPDPQWLIWFLVREKLDLSAFTFACADRAARVYAKIECAPIVDRESALAGQKATYATYATYASCAAARAAAYATYATYATYASCAAARAASYAADAADAAAAHAAATSTSTYAADADAERLIQSEQLKVIWSRWAKS